MLAGGSHGIEPGQGVKGRVVFEFGAGEGEEGLPGWSGAPAPHQESVCRGADHLTVCIRSGVGAFRRLNGYEV